MQEMKSLKTNSQRDEMHMHFSQPSPEELEVLLREITAELNNDHWIKQEEMLLREEEDEQRHSEMQMASFAEGQDGSVSVCAVCKMGYVHRIVQEDKSLRVSCDVPGCLELNFGKIDPCAIHVEQLMNILNGPVLDHKQKCEQNMLSCSEGSLIVSVCELPTGDNDCEMESEETKGSQPTTSNKQPSLMLDCSCCNYNDWLPLNNL
jgi:hypothetical protein